jgi:hypothetical protein
VVSLRSLVVSLRIGRAVTGPVLAVVTGPVLMPVTGRVLLVVVEMVEMVAGVAAATANEVDPQHDRHP